MPYLTLNILEQPFTIHHLPAETPIPPKVLDSLFFILAKTQNEISIAVPEGVFLESNQPDREWVCMKINNEMQEGQTNTLAHITSVLAVQNISTYVTSTFDAHYFLVKIDQLIPAKRALENARCRFMRYKRQTAVA
jgi:hypothetical protein